MSSASPLHSILAAMAGDEYWSTPGSTRPAPAEVPDRTGTRTDAPAPYNLTWLALGQDRQRNLADFLQQHGNPTTHTDGSLYAAAGIIAATDTDAAEDLEALDLADRLLARIALGEGYEAFGHLSCPQCWCYSLAPFRPPVGGWRAACANQCCSTPEDPRTWSLRAVARHHLRDVRAA